MSENQDPVWSINCPYSGCGHKHLDWQNYIDTDDMFGEFPMTCEKCGREFHVKYDTEITFQTKVNEDDEYPGNPTLNELFESWTKELGYNRALLLSFNYPVSKVAVMSEADAEAEIDALKG